MTDTTPPNSNNTSGNGGSNTNTAPPKKNDAPAGGGNEITKSGKFWAGFVLVFVTVLAITAIIAIWPDRTPPVNASDDASWYRFKLFHVSLIKDSPCTAPATDVKRTDSLKKLLALAKDSIANGKDSSATARLSSQVSSLEKQISAAAETKPVCCKEENQCRIHLNTILLLLVALMGLLGNMIHISSSFTTYVGNNDFKKSWILWYWVKPFTAAGLALIVYFIIRAGFLSYGTGASNISLYGILALSALAGLFTDSATLKLKEVFEVIFKPKDERADKLSDASISTVFPTSISPGAATTLTLVGKNLDKAGLIISMDASPVTPASISSTQITFTYTPTAAAVAAGKAVLLVVDKDNKPVLPSKDIIIK